MRFTCLFIIASTLLSTSIVFALPVAVPKDQSFSKCSTDVGSDVIPSLAHRYEVESDELLDRDRDILDLFRRASGGPGVKITFSPTAQKVLDKLKLTNEDRKKVTDYHKELINSHLAQGKFPLPKVKPDSAVITHVAHVGGMDKAEPLHLNAIFRKDNVAIRQRVKIQDPAGGFFKNKYTRTVHVYPIEGEHNLPPAYAAANAQEYLEHTRDQDLRTSTV